MGGEGSGRKPDINKRVMQTFFPIAEQNRDNLIIPDFSGVGGNKASQENFYSHYSGALNRNLIDNHSGAIGANAHGDSFLLNTGDIGVGDYTFDNVYLTSGSRMGIGTYAPVKDIHISGAGITNSILIDNLSDSSSTTTEGSPYFLPPRTSALILKNTSGSFAFSLFGNDGTVALKNSFRVYNPENNKAPMMFEFPERYGAPYTAIYVTSGSQVGVNTTSPAGQLHVGAKVDGWTIPTLLVLGDTRPTIKVQNSTSTNRLVLRADVAATGVRIEAQDNSPLIFHTNAGAYDGNERMRIEAGGDIQINGGDLYFSGDGTGLHYGHTYGNEEMWGQVGAVQNTWYPITSGAGYTSTQLNGITHSAGVLKMAKAGRYLVNYAVSGEVDTANKHLQTAVSGAVIYPSYSHMDFPTPSAQQSTAGTMILDLAANEAISIAVRTTDAGTPNIIIDHASLTATMIGGT